MEPLLAKSSNQSVVQEWLAEVCTLKQQTVLLSALRGCDGRPKEDPSKPVTRAFRATILYSAHKNPGDQTFMQSNPHGAVRAWLNDGVDSYPMHWLIHFMHAIEIVGYKHPNERVATFWLGVYCQLCDVLHLRPETKSTLDRRLADHL